MEGSSIVQLLLYLVVPAVLGFEFFLCAKHERGESEEPPIGSLVLDFFGVVFMGIVPAIFLFTLWAVSSRFLSLQGEAIHRLQRYGVMFMFLGAWWQVYIYAALRARRKSGSEQVTPGRLWFPFLALGSYASMVVAWNFPWHMDLVSVAWFFLLTGILYFVEARPRTIERVFWVLAALTFGVENMVFVWFNAII